MISLTLNDAEAVLHFFRVKDSIQQRTKNILSRGIKRKKAPVTINSTLANYLNNLLDDTHLKVLITASPASLKSIAASISVACPDFLSSKSNANFVLRNIFIDHAYDNPLFSKLQFIKNINIDTCPYCNRNYIYYLSKDKGIKPEIDHFFPKSKYPFFAMSFYNLIPSCQTCNGLGAKEENDPIEKDLVNPYEITNSDFKLSFEIISIDVINPLINKNSISIKFIKKLPGHINIFKLEDLYQQHSDHALELIIKSKLKYAEKYRDYLQQYNGFKFSDDEIDRLILGTYSLEEEIHKRPLAKLYQDIGKELGLIRPS